MKQILLVSLSGREQGGVMVRVAEVLAEHGANILDITKADIHTSLSVGLLVELEADASGLKPQLCELAQAADLQLSFQAVSEVSYQQWVQQQGQDRYILTLLSRKVTAVQLAQVASVAERHGLVIDHVSRLSGRIALDESSSLSKACVEFSVRGKPVSVKALKDDFMELSATLELDVAFQKDDLYRRNRRLVCFDMDSTLIEVEVIDELAKAAGVGAQVAAITESAMRGELDFNESFSARMALLKGLDESVLEQVAANLPITEGAAHLISTLKRLGYKTAILSGGFNYFAEHLQSKLGLDYVYANELPIVEGKVTGEVNGAVVNGERKAQLLRELAAKEGISLEQVIAVGDGANDLPMLGIAGLGIAFRAKPLVKASAEQSISTLGLDAILYLIGCRDQDLP